eukprot:Lithocolla_globosa_v1_NODE_223_length_5052_cov_23.804283.p2 type:complete len:345 gc:universal NODE_223_length_5052_cov_23.804283:967-2001(+)
MSELRSALMKLKRGKVPGADGLPAELFQNLPEEALQRLLRLFNSCLRQSSVPKSWFYQEIVLILKPLADPARLSGRRPITLVDTVTKLFEIVFYARFVEVLAPKLHEEQAGSQRRRSCPEQLFTLLRSIGYVNGVKKGCVLAVFLDIVKAFDTVDHRALFVSLWRDGIGGRAWLLFQRWYSNLEAAVRLGKRSMSDLFSLTCGTRQGGVLSPLFYLCYINGLLTRLKQRNVGLEMLDGILASLLVVDDIVLLAESTTDMKVLLAEATCFAEEWRVRFHLAATPRLKSAVLCFSPAHVFIPPPPMTCACVGNWCPPLIHTCMLALFLRRAPPGTYYGRVLRPDAP